MKCSITNRNSWSKSGKVLTVGSANVFMNIKEMPEECMVVAPVKLSYVKQNDGKLGRPMVNVGQPTYLVKKGKNAGKWMVSYLSIHLNGAAVKCLEKLMDIDWFRKEVKRLFKTSKAADFQLVKGEWKHVGDRELTSADNAEDEDFLREAVADADAFAAKASEKAPAATDESTAGDVAKEVLDNDDEV